LFVALVFPVWFCVDFPGCVAGTFVAFIVGLRCSYRCARCFALHVVVHVHDCCSSFCGVDYVVVCYSIARLIVILHRSVPVTLFIPVVLVIVLFTHYPLTCLGIITLFQFTRYVVVGDYTIVDYAHCRLGVVDVVERRCCYCCSLLLFVIRLLLLLLFHVVIRYGSRSLLVLRLLVLLLLFTFIV
jgi:hypothetical protein